MVKEKWIKYEDKWFYVNKRGKMAVNSYISNKSKFYYVNNKGALEAILKKPKSNGKL